MPPTSAPTPWWIIPTMAPTPAATAPVATQAPFNSVAPTAAPPNAALSSGWRLGGYISLGVALILLGVSALAAVACGARALAVRRRRVVAAENAVLARSGCHSASSGSDSDSDSDSVSTSASDDFRDARRGVARARTAPRATPLAALSTSALHAWLCYNELACFAASIDRLGMDGVDAAQLEEEEITLLADAARGSIYAFQRVALVNLLRDARQHGIPHYELRGVVSVADHDREQGSNAIQLRALGDGIHHGAPPSFRYDRME